MAPEDSANRFLTFDCYGTLIDWRRGIEESLQKSFGVLPVKGSDLLRAYVEAEKKQEEIYQRYREVLTKTSMELCKSLGVGASKAAAEEFAASVPDWPAFPDTTRALKEFGRLGYKRYILSNVDTDLLRQTIEKNDLEVDGFVTAEEVGTYKPAHGHWDAFFQRTDSGRGQLLHVAQSLYHDIVPCGKMGLACAWVNRYEERLTADARPDIISDDLEHLSKLLA